MKHLLTVTWLAAFVMAMVATSYSAPRIYKWVKDKRESSDQLLSKSQSSRVLPIAEGQTLELVRATMSKDLYMAVGEFQKSKQKQLAETTSDTVLPEEIVRTREIDLIDENYIFVLEVRMKKYGNRTRVMAKASPVYRVRDYDAEAAAGSDDDSGQSVEVKIKSAQGSGITMGPIVVAPIYGVPSEYGAQPIPDASKRASLLVRSFMYLLDKRVSAVNASQAEAADVTAQVQDSNRPASESPQASNENSEVSIKIKSK